MKEQVAQSQVTMTTDTIFVMHYMDGLKSLQSTWMEGNEINELAFGMQIDYLIRLIPNLEIQKTIENERKTIEEKLKKMVPKPDHIIERASLIVVTHFISFLCNSFDMLHIDINGPATSKQYRDAIVEIPDMVKVELVTNVQ